MAKFHPNNKVIDKSWRIWAEIAQRTFGSGKYDPLQEIRAYEDIDPRAQDDNGGQDEAPKPQPAPGPKAKVSARAALRQAQGG